MKKLLSILLSIVILLSITSVTYQFAPRSSPASTTLFSSILITEVLYDAPVDETTEEWIELYNPTISTISLSGWTISDATKVFSLSGNLNSGEYLILAKDEVAFQTLYGFSPNISTLTLNLGNQGDFLSLKDAGYHEIDFVAWASPSGKSRWTIDTSNASIYRSSDTNLVPIDTNSVSDWKISKDLGTPAAGYQVFISEAPSVSLLSPLNNTNVKGDVHIIFTAIDPDGISSYALLINSTIVTTLSQYVWKTDTLENGIYIITAKANDTLNNWGQSIIVVTVGQPTNNSSMNLPSFKLITYNIEQSGIDPSWIDVIKEENADILVLVETGTWDDNNNRKLAEVLIELNAFFENEAPYDGVTDQGVPFSTSGVAILSRFEIISFNDIESIRLDDGTSFNPSHDFAHAELDLGNQSIHVIGTHLKCCGGSDNEIKREKAQEGIINYMDELGNVPIIYTGDLNSFSPEDTKNMGNLNDEPITMLLDSSHPKSSIFHVWQDVHKVLNPMESGYTYVSSPYVSRIDFIFVNQFFFGFLQHSTTGDTASAITGSDHFSVDVFIDFSQSIASSGPIDIGTISTISSEMTNISPTTGFEFVFIIMSFFGLVIIRKKEI